MLTNVSSSMQADLSPFEYSSDPEDNEISDEEDDDRNHKHRRRETRSDFSEKDTVESTIAGPFRKHNRAFQNDHSFSGNESQVTPSWKSYESSDRDFSNKFEKRLPGSTSFSRAPFDLSQKRRATQSFTINLGPGRGRGRDSGTWNYPYPRFNSMDITSQMIQRGSIPPGLFSGRGLPGVPSVQNGSWGMFGTHPVTTGVMEALPSVGLKGTFSSVNMDIPRPRCRDFEERGFCLRGDMCPMEHGVNRIVIEDVQSLSQFNLPISLPSAPILGTSPLPGGLPSVSSSSAMQMNNKQPNGKYSKSIVPDAVTNSSYSTFGNVGASDLYDPDQPLWSNGRPEAPPLLSLHSQHADDTELFDHNITDHQAKEVADLGRQAGGAEFHRASQATSLSVWGRIGRGKSDKKGDFGSKTSTLGFSGNENGDASAGSTRSSHHGKQIITRESGQNVVGSSNQAPSDTIHTPRKPTQKALRTLFVSCIPQKNNRRDALFAHFKKFGEVIDIHIPSSSERAFVQFSKRQEAESALNAPEAVMGNRFIKLWWANHDNVVDEGMGNSLATLKSLTGGSVPGNLSIAGRGKDIYSAPLKAGEAAESGTRVQASDQSKPIIANGPKVTPPKQKKLESLEQLKEELRKKQVMLERKRNEFKRQLDKLERQASGPKGEVNSEQSNKRQKVGSAGDVGNVSPLTSSDAAAMSVKCCSTTDEVVSSQNDVLNPTDDSTSIDLPSANTLSLIEESSPSKEQTESSAAVIPPSPNNGQIIDSSPTSFKVLPPLPTGLANVAALEEHFSAYGDLTIVKLEHMDECSDADDVGTTKSLSARIGFGMHASAERAFNNGKCWQDHSMNFLWYSSSRNVVPHLNEESSLMDKIVQPSGKGQCESRVEVDNGVANGSAS